MSEMVKSSTVTQKIFSFYLSGESGQSYIDFGLPNTAVYKDASLYVSIPVKANSPYWTNTVSGVRWTTNSNDKTEYKLNANDAIIDSGSSCIVGPKSDINFIRNTILNQIQGVSTSTSWDYQFACANADRTKLPSF